MVQVPGVPVFLHAGGGHMDHTRRVRQSDQGLSQVLEISPSSGTFPSPGPLSLPTLFGCKSEKKIIKLTNS